MIREFRERFAGGGLYPLLAAGAAIVIVAFGVVAYLGSQRTTPNTGGDAGQLALAPASPSGSASASATASSATSTSAPSKPVPVQVAPTPAPKLVAGAVLVDRNAPAGTPTWQSGTFTAPNTWTISYAYDCGGYGGHFTVAAFSDLMQKSPVDKHGDKGSGTVVVQGGGRGVYIAVDTTNQCSWHVTARA